MVIGDDDLATAYLRGGDTREPVMPTRTGPKANRGFSPSPSTRDARSAASIPAVSNGSTPARASIAASSTCAASAPS